MSTTMSFCAMCGGMRAPAGTKVQGLRCTCTESTMGRSSGSNSVAASASVGSSSSSGGGVATAHATATGMKLCCVCRADVTDKKRMKDSATGRYWCYECYVIELRKKNTGMTMHCPHCNKDYPPLKMLKHGEGYWCESCEAEQHTKGTKKKAAGDSAGAQPAMHASNLNTKKFITIGVVVGLAALVYSYFMFWQ
jgi:hypothetical protein